MKIIQTSFLFMLLSVLNISCDNQSQIKSTSLQNDYEARYIVYCFTNNNACSTAILQNEYLNFNVEEFVASNESLNVKIITDTIRIAPKSISNVGNQEILDQFTMMMSISNLYLNNKLKDKELKVSWFFNEPIEYLEQISGVVSFEDCSIPTILKVDNLELEFDPRFGVKFNIKSDKESSDKIIVIQNELANFQLTFSISDDCEKELQKRFYNFY